MRMFLARTAAFLFAILFWVATIAKAAVDWLGRTTAPDDYNQLVERFPAMVAWLLATPWWVPGGLASALTGFLLWAGWPAGQANSRWVSRKEKYRDLGIRALQVAQRIDHFTSVGKWVGNGGALGAEIYAVMVRFNDMGFAIPAVAASGDQDEWLSLAFRYLSAMGALLRDGSVAEAQLAAREMAAKSDKSNVASPNGI